MRGWILYRDSLATLKPDAYEVPRLLETAARENLDVKLVTPQQFDLLVACNSREIWLDEKSIPAPDFLLPRTGAHSSYFALAVVRHLEQQGVLVLNSSTSIETGKDKLHTHQILSAHGLPLPRTMLVKFPVDVEQVGKLLGFPVIVKTVSGVQGNGVYLCEDRVKLQDLLDLLAATRSSANLLLQEFIKTSYGRDLRVLVIGGKVVACIERASADGGFKANFSRGGMVRPYRVAPKIEKLALEAARLLGLDIAGVDLLFDGRNNFKICEVNSCPGFNAIESCSPVDIPAQIYEYVRARLGISLES
jgi:gamma-F420-2:alpha-L-glutamate ligase